MCNRTGGRYRLGSLHAQGGDPAQQECQELRTVCALLKGLSLAGTQFFPQMSRAAKLGQWPLCRGALEGSRGRGL